MKSMCILWSGECEMYVSGYFGDNYGLYFCSCYDDFLVFWKEKYQIPWLVVLGAQVII